jgi:hypothetical protein
MPRTGRSRIDGASDGVRGDIDGGVPDGVEHLRKDEAEARRREVKGPFGDDEADEDDRIAAQGEAEDHPPPAKQDRTQSSVPIAVTAAAAVGIATGAVTATTTVRINALFIATPAVTAVI